MNNSIDKMTGVRTVESSREVQYDLFVLRISNGGLIVDSGNARPRECFDHSTRL